MVDKSQPSTGVAPSLEASVGPLGEDPVGCTLDALDDMSAKIRVPRGTEVPETSSLALWLSDPDSGTAVALPAYSGWLEEDGDDMVCELYFAQPNALQSRVDESLERRVDTRVSLPPDEVEVWVASDKASDGEGVVECVLVDLGTGGMCVELTVGLEPTTPFSNAEFQVLLPGQTWPLVLNAQVRHRARVSREVVRYGLEFDIGRCVDFAEQRESLTAFVQERVSRIADQLQEADRAMPAA